MEAVVIKQFASSLGMVAAAFLTMLVIKAEQKMGYGMIAMISFSEYKNPTW
jgi:hypothetical protein